MVDKRVTSYELRVRKNKMITKEPINLNSFLSQQPKSNCGAVSTFVGVVRDHHEGRSVKKMLYDCYVSMAEKEIQKIINQTKETIGVVDIQVIHRIGEMNVGDPCIAIWVSASHRDEAFRACREVIDKIKQTVPIWKKETYVEGDAQWVLCGHINKEKVLTG